MDTYTQARERIARRFARGGLSYGRARYMLALLRLRYVGAK